MMDSCKTHRHNKLVENPMAIPKDNTAVYTTKIHNISISIYIIYTN